MKRLFKNAVINGQRLNLLTEGAYIAYIGEEIPPADELIDLEGKIILPGMIDPHVHVRDLGQSEKEDWHTASQAALKGGVTTLFDMPNTIPPTTNRNALNLKREAARKSAVRYKFNFGVTEHNLREIKEILNERFADIAALKMFLAGSSANEYVEDIDTIRRVFDLSYQFDIPVIIHTEIQKCIEKYASLRPHPGILDHGFIRHRECTNRGTELVIKLAKEIGNPVYIAHTSTAEEVQMIRENKNKARIYCEVTPHHLLLNEHILHTAGNYAKVNPPLRTEADNRALWEAVSDGTVDAVGTDHAPHTLAEKNKPYPRAPSGFPGLETGLPLLLNEVKKGKLSLARLVELYSTRAAEIFGLNDRGNIRTGKKADLVIVDMNKTARVEARNFVSKAKYSPYEGMEIIPVEMTVMDGMIKYLRNQTEQ